MGQASLPDGHQLAFGSDGLDVAARGTDVKRGDAKIAAIANLTGGESVHHFRGKLRQHLDRGNDGFVKTSRLGQSPEPFQGAGAIDLEIAGSGPAQGLEKCAAAQGLSGIVGDAS